MKVTFDNVYNAFQIIAPKGTMISFTGEPTALADGVYLVGDDGIINLDEQFLTDTLYLSTEGTDYAVTGGVRVIYPLGDETLIIRAGSSAIPFSKGAKGGGSSGDGTHYKGTTTTALTDGSTTNPITILIGDEPVTYTAVMGDIVVYGSSEFIFDSSVWKEIGRGVDTTPTSGSANFVTSDGVYKKTPWARTNQNGAISGEFCTATSAAVAAGRYANATAYYTAAFGESLVANQRAMTAVGKWNKVRTGDLFNIGNGSSTTQSNIVEANSTELNVNGEIKKNGVSLPTPYTTMPTITEAMLGQIAMYVGTTGGGFTQGYFYIAATDGAAEPTYTWVHLPTQNGYSETVLYTNALENDPETSILLSDSYTNYDNLCVCLGKKDSYWFAPYTVCKSLMSNGSAFGLTDEVGYVNAVLTDATHITIRSAASGYGVYKVIGINYGNNGGAVANPVRSLAKSEEEASETLTPTEDDMR